MARDYYGLLGLSRNASDAEIKRAYRKMARELHPDVNPDEQAQQLFKEISVAYEVLSDPEKRRIVDLGGDPLESAGAGNGFLIFKNCMFINLGTALTVGIDNTGVGTAMKFIQDVNTMWTGVTDIIAAASEASVLMGTGNYVAAATANGIATTFDHTA